MMRQPDSSRGEGHERRAHHDAAYRRGLIFFALLLIGLAGAGWLIYLITTAFSGWFGQNG
jgi:hypothetical protein